MRLNIVLRLFCAVIIWGSISIPFASSQSIVTGSLSSRVDSLTNTFPSTEGTNEYQAPTTTQLNQWGTVITEIYQGNFSGANTDAAAFGYHLIQFIDNSTSPNKTYYILEKTSASSNHWGVFIFNPAPQRPKLVIASPHPLHDLYTEKQGRQILMRTGARALFIAGTHRCNSSSFTTCSGTTTACSDTSQKYRLSDPAHVANGTFQKTTEILRSKIPTMILVQNHGFGKDSGDPDLIMSNGTRFTPATDYVVSLRNNLQTIDSTLTYKIAHVDLTWTQLIATENTQGRYINGSVNPCTNSAGSTTGRFIHVEQALSKLRDSETNRRKLSDALAKTISADTLTITSPNGSESWVGGSVHSITWTSKGFVDSVKLEYSLNNGESWNTITSSIPNSGLYSWTVPPAGSWRARVRVSDIANSVTTDASNSQFAITYTCWPTTGTTSVPPIASAFGPRMLSGVYDFHRGLDFPNALNTPVHPVKAGVIVRMEDTSVTIGTGLERYGNWILVQHESVSGDPRHTGYLHLNGFSTFQVGDTVSTADTIGFMGNSGVGINTIHTHLEYYEDLSGTSISKDKIYNPFEIMPYTDNNGYIVTTLHQGDSTGIQVRIPAGELDFDEITMYGTTATRTVGLNSRTGIDPVDNDNPLYNNVFIDPNTFSSDSSYKTIRFWTKQGEVGDIDSIQIKDVKGYTAKFVEYSGSRYAVVSGDWESAIWAGSLGGAPGSVPPPSQYDNIQIKSGVTVTVSSTSASCYSILFQDSTASLSLSSGAILNVYGNFTIASSGHKAFSSWASGAKLRFTGSNPQLLSGWSITSNTADSTVLMEVVVDKTGDTLRTPGTDMKLGLGTSLEIVRGVFMLGYRDDINGRTLSGSTKPTITVDTDGVFYMFGSLSSIRTGTSGQGLIGKMTVKGEVHLATTSSIGICMDGVEVQNGGSLYMESFTNTYPNNVLLDTVHIRSGGQVYDNSTVNFWGSSVVMYLDTNATYKVSAATTFFPPTLYNTGTVRYQRTNGDGSQTIADMNYYRLEVSFSGIKTWTMTADRTIYDSLEINNSTSFVITALSTRNLNLNGVLRLTSGSIDNSNTNVHLILPTDGLISRSVGTLSSAPTFGTSVNVRYTSTTSSVSTGPELPVSNSVLQDLTIICDTTTVSLSSPITINGRLTLSNGNFDNSGSTLSFADGATIRRATGVLTAVPQFIGSVNVSYISTLNSAVTGYELPTSVTALDTLGIESPLNITLNSDVTVNKSFILTRGLLFLGDHNFTLGPSASIGGAMSDTTMAVITGIGSFKQILNSMPATFTLPVGDTVNGRNYSPVTFNFTSGNFETGAAVGVRVLNSKHPSNNAPENYLNRYWIVTPEQISDYVCNVSFGYDHEDVVGQESNIMLGQWDGESWSVYNPADTADNVLTGTVTNLAEFSGIPFSQFMSVTSGWNLLSVPGKIFDMTKNSLFPTASSSAFAFQGGYVSAETLQHGKGYWVKFNAGENIFLSGDALVIDTVAVNQGWNMIGSLSYPVVISDIVGLGTTVSSSYFGYNSGYQTADTLHVGKGYWVKVSADGYLILSSSNVFSKTDTQLRKDGTEKSIINKKYKAKLVK